MQILSEKITELFAWQAKLQQINPSITKYRATMLCNNPAEMDADEVRAFSQVLNIPVRDLINDFGCCREKLTISEIEEVINQKIIA